LCYIDIAKELNRDASNDKMINGFGYSLLKNETNSDSNDEAIISSVLSNDPAVRQSVSFFNNYEIINKSTKVSLEKSYRSRSKFYDSVKKELLVFDIESQTSDGSKTLILKGKPNDSTFFKENISTIWIGKQDFYDEGSGNVHKNYNYAIPQNRQNLDDLTKISCKITLPNCNYNLYLFQKILVAFTDIKPSPVNDQKFLKRFTGEWLITNIDFNYDGNIVQEVTLVKRELELSAEEAANTVPKEENKNETSVPESTNELTPSEQSQLSEDSNQAILPETEPTNLISVTASTIDTVNGTASTSVEEVEAEPIQTQEQTQDIKIEIKTISTDYLNPLKSGILNSIVYNILKENGKFFVFRIVDVDGAIPDRGFGYGSTSVFLQIYRGELPSNFNPKDSGVLPEPFNISGTGDWQESLSPLKNGTYTFVFHIFNLNMVPMDIYIKEVFKFI
jgi:hypothetical protein